MNPAQPYNRLQHRPENEGYKKNNKFQQFRLCQTARRHAVSTRSFSKTKQKNRRLRGKKTPPKKWRYKQNKPFKKYIYIRPHCASSTINIIHGSSSLFLCFSSSSPHPYRVFSFSQSDKGVHTQIQTSSSQQHSHHTFPPLRSLPAPQAPSVRSFHSLSRHTVSQSLGCWPQHRSRSAIVGATVEK